MHKNVLVEEILIYWNGNIKTPISYVNKISGSGVATATANDPENELIAILKENIPNILKTKYYTLLKNAKKFTTTGVDTEPATNSPKINIDFSKVEKDYLLFKMNLYIQVIFLIIMFSIIKYEDFDITCILNEIYKKNYIEQRFMTNEEIKKLFDSSS